MQSEFSPKRSTSQPRNFFPGANTRYGFHSRFHHIGADVARHTYVLKGGPGTGKSTFIQRTADEMASRGWTAEFYWCASDEDSLDAVYFPERGISIVDGTHPHMMDPPLPGAADHIIDLSRHWDPEVLEVRRPEIEVLKKRIASHFSAAYTHLAVAGRCSADADRILCRHDAVDGASRARAIRRTAQKIMREGRRRRELACCSPRRRELFISALAPGGAVSYAADLCSSAGHICVVQAETSLVSHSLVSHVRDRAHLAGLACWVFPCSLDPQRLEHCYLPEIHAAVVTSRPDLPVEPPPGSEILEERQFLHLSRAEYLRATLGELAKARHEALARAERELCCAYRLHQDMEGHYKLAMDYAAVEETRTDLTRALARS